MPRVGWRTVSADKRAGIVERVVTLGAERSQLAEAEELVAASMWLDVIRDGRRLDAARFEAYAAQRLDAELVTATTCQLAVPTMNFRTVRHSSVPV
jgi:hypothetical protein